MSLFSRAAAKLHWWMIAASIVILTGHLALSTRWFVQPISVTVTAEEMVLVRKTPLGAHAGATMIDVVAITGRECNMQAEVLFQRAQNDLVVYPTPEALVPCIAEPGPGVMTIQWRVVLGSWLPLRAITTQHVTE